MAAPAQSKEVAWDEESLIGELSQQAYADWVDGVMTRGKPNPYWVWPCSELGAALAKDNPKLWAPLSVAISLKTGWQCLPQLHPENFVHTGEEDGEEYIRRRKYPQPFEYEDKDMFQSEDKEFAVAWYLAPFYYVGAFLGMFLNFFWCCFGYILPNCYFAWAWPCCLAPSKCCGRSYYEYDDIEPQVKTGDIFLFCGDNMTRLGGQSHWSHIGIALRDERGEVGPKGLLYVFEANFGRPGWDHCDIRLIREKLETYKGGSTDAAWRPLLADDEQREQIGRAIQDRCGCAYDHDLGHMFMAAADFCPCFENGKVKRQSEMFCSEAVAKILQMTGVLPEPPDGPPACEYLPRDFGSRGYGCNEENSNAQEILGPTHMIQRYNAEKWTGLSFH